MGVVTKVERSPMTIKALRFSLRDGTLLYQQFTGEPSQDLIRSVKVKARQANLDVMETKVVEMDEAEYDGMGATSVAYRLLG